MVRAMIHIINPIIPTHPSFCSNTPLPNHPLPLFGKLSMCALGFGPFPGWKIVFRKLIPGGGGGEGERWG